MLRTWLTVRRCAQTAIDAAELLLSELISNAVRHTSTSLITVRAAWAPGVLRLAVRDDSKLGLTAPGSDVSSGQEGGRGLWLVARIADNWGWQSAGDGKEVWFELGCRPGDVVRHDD